METSVKNIIERCAHESHAGTTNFGAIIGALIEAGVESYQVDYRAADTTYYLPDGDALTLSLPVPEMDIAQEFDAPALQQAIRGAQQDRVKYPEFLKLSMAAGVVGYIVWIAGKQVTYFGRRGETHVERFPS